MADVFLSYANEDRERVRGLVAVLEARGLSVWWDRRIPAGQSFREVIEQALRDARCVVVVWSSESVASKWVREEADEGLQRDIMVPLLLDKVLPPIGFRSIQAADLTAWKGEPDDAALHGLLADIRAKLQHGGQVETANPPAAHRVVTRDLPAAPQGIGRGLKLAGGGLAAVLAAWGLFQFVPRQSAGPERPAATANPPDAAPASAPTAKGEAASRATPLPELVKAEPPPSGYYLMPAIGEQPETSVRLVKLSDKRNQITDDADWWVANALQPLTYEVPNPFRQRTGNLPDFVPPVFNGLRVVTVQRGDPIMAIYGADYSEGRYLLAIDAASGKPLFAFDFSLYEWPTEFQRQEQEFVKMALRWALVDGKTLYVAHAHSTYAKSSNGFNAYLTAIDIASGRVLWRSQPLVSNAGNFVLHGDALISGYGFTQEKDYLYVINRADGRVVQQLPVRSGPDYLVAKGFDRLYVRTYDTDYVFELRR